jgi:sulfatase modifying factor 1
MHAPATSAPPSRATRLDAASLVRRGLVAVGVAAAAAWVVVFARATPAMPKCGAGLVEQGPRCCADGQGLRAGHCDGPARTCPTGFERARGARGGCAALAERVRIEQGTSSWQPPDTTLGTAGERAETPTFWLDGVEVHWARYDRCASVHACAPLPAHPADELGQDLGQAVHSVNRDEARAFCRWAGGHLPRDSEWLRAAIGDVEKRYPWGDPDALCTRATFGLVEGPCAVGAIGPDTAGARPFGATPLGAQDLAGNVAEWIDDDALGAAAGMGAVRGGSYLERDATALRARWRKVIAASARAPWIGFRCAYDRSTDGREEGARGPR